MIESFLKFLQFEKRYSTHTLQAYRRDLLQFQVHIGENSPESSIDQADHNLIRSWLISLVEKKLSPNSVNRKVATLRSYYKFLLSRDYISKDPTYKVKALKTKKQLPVFIQEKDMELLLDHTVFEDNFEGWRNKLALEILYGTGIRLSELIHLKESDVNVYEGTIKVLGKRNKERVIPLSKSLGLIIEYYQRKKFALFGGNSAGVLLVTDTNQQCYPMMVYRIVRKYLDAATTADRRSPHVLRHTFATHLLDKGAELNAVKDLLGHTSLAATQVYTHNTLDKLKKVFDQAHPKSGN